ncbi:MAG: hypothetical protein E6Q06_04900 [Candidatus Moraniibacteriota bacterium]|nr:MAG: hypothetical protein E6Q06_04900 [Candidatus Moranbacteria bacterium]
MRILKDVPECLATKNNSIGQVRNINEKILRSLFRELTNRYPSDINPCLRPIRPRHIALPIGD